MPISLSSPAARPRSHAVAGNHAAGLLERMPKWLICVPLVAQWLWLSLRYRSLTLPSAANPALTSGGLVGEGKREYFEGMGSLARAATARWCAVSTAGRPSPAELLDAMNGAGVAFPVVAKPDLGLCGHGVRRVDDMAELQAYLAAFPRDECVLLQEYLPQEGEAGIFYVRDPMTGEGRITGLALRYFPRVSGDGRHDVRRLIAMDPRAARLASAARSQGPEFLGRVPAQGETVRLATVGSTRVGGLYRDGGAFITPALVAAVDAVARDMREFHFGRFDVRFEDLRSLANGRGFTIMEVNGAASEAIQAWDPDIGLFRGIGIVFAKQRLAFATGDAMRRLGAEPIGVMALARLNARQNGLTAKYPPSN